MLFLDLLFLPGCLCVSQFKEDEKQGRGSNSTLTLWLQGNKRNDTLTSLTQPGQKQGRRQVDTQQNSPRELQMMVTAQEKIRSRIWGRHKNKMQIYLESLRKTENDLFDHHEPTHAAGVSFSAPLWAARQKASAPVMSISSETSMPVSYIPATSQDLRA